jgi:hypothetical protein
VPKLGASLGKIKGRSVDVQLAAAAASMAGMDREAWMTLCRLCQTFSKVGALNYGSGRLLTMVKSKAWTGSIVKRDFSEVFVHFNGCVGD